MPDLNIANQTPMPSAIPSARRGTGSQRSDSSSAYSTTATHQREHIDRARVGDRQHQQPGEIVDHRQRQQEDAHARGRARRQQADRRQREGGVGRDRRAPAVRARPTGVPGQVDRGRHGDAAERRHAGTATRRRSRSSPRSSWRLASSPTTRKNSVISPWLTQVRRSAEIASPPSRNESRVPQTVLVAVRRGRVGPDQRRDGRDDHHRGATALGAQEVTDRRGEVARPGGAPLVLHLRRGAHSWSVSGQADRGSQSEPLSGLGPARWPAPPPPETCAEI